jgi:hypothetical protein
VRLTWNKVDIPPYHRDEEPLMYMVEISEPPMDEWRPVVTGLPTTRYRVTNLLPDRDYRFRVRGVTPYGVTPPSYSLPVSYRRPTPGEDWGATLMVLECTSTLIPRSYKHGNVFEALDKCF